jgi:hypothetical protein
MPFYGGAAQTTDPKFIMDRLMKGGMSRMQAAAVIGNLQQESGLASNAMNKDEGAYGLMQWRGPRFEALQQFAAKAGLPWTDPGVQADFISHEMNTTEKGNAAAFRGARTIDEASAALHPVIRYGDDSGPARATFARNVFGGDPSQPQTGAAPASVPQPQVGQPAVSRGTYRPTDAQLQEAWGSRPQRGLRGGIASLGDVGAAYISKSRQPQAPSGGLGGQPPVVSGGEPDPRSAVTSAVVGAPPVAQTPPGAPAPPVFPGGVPQPRARPLEAPYRDDRLLPQQPVAEMGALVDPMRYDYG